MPACGFETCPRRVQSGGEWCLFHAPKTVDSDTEAFRKALDPLIASNEDDPGREHDYRGFIFPPMEIEGLRMTKKVDFSDSQFVGDVQFHRCVFGGGVSFAGARFQGRAEFHDVYCVPGRFELIFERATPQDGSKAPAMFTGATFHDQFSFERSELNAGLLLDELVVHGDARFSSLEIHGSFDVSGSVWHRDLRCTDLDVWNDTIFDGCTFGGRTEIAAGERKSGGRLSFRRVNLRREAAVVLEDVDLRETSFEEANIESFVFRNVQWCRIRLMPWSAGRVALWDELRLRKSSPIWVQSHLTDPQDSPFFDAGRNKARHARLKEAVAENYRQLVNNFERRRDYATAEEFHIGEMESLRLRQPWTLNGYAIYWILSRYGTSYRHALVVLLLIVAGLAAAFLFTGLRPASGEEDAREAIEYDLADTFDVVPSREQLLADFGEAVLFVVGVASFSRERVYEPLGWQSRALVPFTVIALTSQTALLLFAIRRRFKR